MLDVSSTGEVSGAVVYCILAPYCSFCQACGECALWSCGHGMGEMLEGMFDVSWHGYVTGAVFVVPIECKSTVT